MKKTTKLLSLVFALIFALSVFVIPSYAALSGDEDVTIRMELAPVVGETDAEGNKSEDNGIYKLSIYLDSNVKVAGIGAIITYSEDLITPLNPSEGQIYYQYVCDDEFKDVAYGALGTLADTGRYNSSGAPVTSRPSYYGPSYSSSYLNIATYRASAGRISFLYQAVAKTLIPGANGEEGIAYLYFKLNEGKTAADLEGAKFAIEDNYVRAVAVCENPEVGKFFTNNTTVTDLPNFKTPDYTYTAPVAKELVVRAKAQVKMTLDAANAPVIAAATPFSLRVVSEIPEDAWTNTFAGTDTSSNIEKVGIVAYKGDGAFDLETAKSVIGGATVADYKAADTDYIQKRAGEPARFGARIDFTAQENIKDVTYMAYVVYDGGQYAFYNAECQAKLLSSYNEIVAAYVGQYGTK